VSPQSLRADDDAVQVLLGSKRDALTAERYWPRPTGTVNTGRPAFCTIRSATLPSTA
jgi:hypothetical protein